MYTKTGSSKYYKIIKYLFEHVRLTKYIDGSYEKIALKEKSPLLIGCYYRRKSPRFFPLRRNAVTIAWPQITQHDKPKPEPDQKRVFIYLFL